MITGSDGLTQFTERPRFGSFKSQISDIRTSIRFDYPRHSLLNSCMLVILLIMAILASYGDSEAAIYKYKDANGAILFTDSPVYAKRPMKTYKTPAYRKARYKPRYIAAPRAATQRQQVCQAGGTKSLPGTSLDSIINRKAAKYNVDPHLVKAVIKNESAFNDRAVSAKGAMGLMQLMPQTANSMGVYDAFDPAENIDGGTHYLSGLLNKFGSVSLALAAYNAGPSCVQKLGGVPPYRETEYYVQKVLSDYRGGTYYPATYRTRINGHKAIATRKTTMIYKIKMKDGTVLYTNDFPSGF